MFWQDNETIVDLLNYDSISNTIIKLLENEKSLPVSIGIHGDWGAGKSSVLSMLYENYKNDQDTICIKFNGWLFQGFEDAKIALLEQVLSEINSKKGKFEILTENLINLHKRFNYLKLFKNIASYGSSYAITALTGSPDFKSLGTALSKIMPKEDEKKNEKKSKEESKEDKWLNEQEKNSLTNQIDKFREEFEKLLKESKIKRFIVLIDDLDRCLPETTINILESMRLLLFVPKTAFIIAADEAMIEYCVKKHFPDLPISSSVQNYTKNYLEKLIQIPFRLPSLGTLETESYLKLLFLEKATGFDHEKYQKLINKAKEKLKKPWETSNILDINNDVKPIILSVDQKLEDSLFLAKQASSILVKGTKGNPRQLKRFLNSFSIRYEIAKASGYESLIEENILLKLMLLEHFQHKAFEKISEEIMSNISGFSENFTNKDKINDKDFDKEWLEQWIDIKPDLKNIDLRAYIFVSRDKKRFFNTSNDDIVNNLIEKINKITKPDLVITIERDIQELKSEQVQNLYTYLETTIIGLPDLKNKNVHIEAIKLLAKNHVSYQYKMIDAFLQIPPKNFGTWIASGWNKVITDQEAINKLKDLMDKLKQNGNSNVIIAINNIQTTIR